MDPFFGVLMDDGLEKKQIANANPEFFFQFAMQTGFKSLASLDFASRKFPKTAQMIFGPALGDEQFTAPKNQTCRDVHLPVSALHDP